MIILKIFLAITVLGLSSILIVIALTPWIFKLSKTNYLRLWWEKYIIIEDPNEK